MVRNVEVQCGFFPSALLLGPCWLCRNLCDRDLASSLLQLSPMVFGSPAQSVLEIRREAVSSERVGWCPHAVEFPTTRSELNYVFDIIDNTHSGEITYRQFINVLHHDRKSKVTVELHSSPQWRFHARA